jgi:DNA-binding NarL/FixJ family response regulator
MRVFWEQAGALGPVYRLVGQGFSDRDIATKLDLTELRVQACIVWILHFLGFTNRNERSDTPQLRRQRKCGTECERWAARHLLLRIAAQLVV